MFFEFNLSLVIFVAVGAEMSTIRNIENGVVGAVLNVTLFLISMSQIYKNVGPTTKNIGFDG
jgi:hypothetical protein